MPRLEVPKHWNPRVQTSGDILPTTFAMGRYARDQLCMNITDDATNRGFYVGAITLEDAKDLCALIQEWVATVEANVGEDQR